MSRRCSKGSANDVRPRARLRAAAALAASSRSWRRSPPCSPFSNLGARLRGAFVRAAALAALRAGARQPLDLPRGPRDPAERRRRRGRPLGIAVARRPHARRPRRCARPWPTASRACATPRSASSRPAPTAPRPTARRFSARSPTRLADVPPERVGGAILVTDGVVHDVPAEAAALGFNAPVHALVTGRADERDRRIALVEAPRFGIVGRAADGPLPRPRPGPWTCPVAPWWWCAATARRSSGASVAAGEVDAVDVEIAHGGTNIVEIEAEAVPGELTEVNNRVVLPDRGHPRQDARAPRLRRAACRRAHLAQPPQGRRQCRARPFHHPAPAAQAGRHADQRAVADRLPDPHACSPRRSPTST